MFCQFDLHVAQKNLECPPVFKYLIFSKDGKWMKYLLRGDGDGRLAVWKVPDTPECAMMQLKRSEGGGNGEVASHPIQSICSLDEIWASLLPKPPGVLNQVLITKIFQIFDRKSFSKIKYLSFSFSTLLQQDNKLVSWKILTVNVIFEKRSQRLTCSFRLKRSRWRHTRHSRPQSFFQCNADSFAAAKMDRSSWFQPHRPLCSTCWPESIKTWRIGHSIRFVLAIMLIKHIPPLPWLNWNWLMIKFINLNRPHFSSCSAMPDESTAFFTRITNIPVTMSRIWSRGPSTSPSASGEVFFGLKKLCLQMLKSGSFPASFYLFSIQLTVNK